MNLSNTRLMLPALPTFIVQVFGCSSGSSDDEYRRLIEGLSRRQAAQQDGLIRQSQHLTEASKHLVDADASGRRELTGMQSRLQQKFASERQNIDGQRTKLDDGPREIAAQRFSVFERFFPTA